MAHVGLVNRHLRAYTRKGKPNKFHIIRPPYTPGDPVGISVCNHLFWPGEQGHADGWIEQDVRDVAPGDLCAKCFAGFYVQDNPPEIPSRAVVIGGSVNNSVINTGSNNESL